MSFVVNAVRKGAYFDSVALMRIAQQIRCLEAIEEAGLMIGTPANRAVLRDAGVLGAEGEAAGPGDIVIAIRGATQAAASEALATAIGLLDRTRGAAADQEADSWRPRTLRRAVEALPEANLALISVPGDFAAAEAHKALQRGLDVMIFSDNVSLADEVALKEAAGARGRIVMGPDCGTAIIAGVPIAFANAVPRGDVGIVGASGTGIQEVSCLIAHLGRGISHALGTGGRDLKAEVGGRTTLAAIDLLDADPATRHIVLVSKPPAAAVARAVLARVARSPKACTICFLGADSLEMPANARQARTLTEAARMACGQTAGATTTVAPAHDTALRGPSILGLFAGGTLCMEAQLVLAGKGLAITSNVPIAQAEPMRNGGAAGHHVLIDLGDDAYTRGRPHPMIEPAVREAPLRAAMGDAAVGIILIDVVLGFGAHPDPAGHLALVLASAPRRPLVIASVTGTDADPQHRLRQVERLQAAGVLIAASNAQAAAWAGDLVMRAARRDTAAGT